MTRSVQAVTQPRITLIGRPGCHLCESAREVVQRVAADTATGWTELSVDGDADLAQRYGELVPVVLVDGSQHCCYQVDEQRLRDALAGRRGWLHRRRAASG
jgi:hypothetical protein